MEDHKDRATSIDRLIVRTPRICETFCQWMLLIAITGCCCTRPERLTSPTIASPNLALSIGGWFSGVRASSGPALSRDDQIADYESARGHASPTSETFLSASEFGENAYALAERLHAEADDRAVDYWARAVAWMDEAANFASDHHCRANRLKFCGACENPTCRSMSVRQSAIVRILSEGQCYGRLDPASHLLINGPVRTYRIPIIHRGFAWKPNDFNRLVIFKPSVGSMGNLAGHGIPLVVLTPGATFEPSRPTLCASLFEQPKPRENRDTISCESFVYPGTPFAATARLHLPVSLFLNLEGTGDEHYHSVDDANLTLINPLETFPLQGSDAIAQSPAMPLDYLQQGNQYDPIMAFVNGDNGVDKAGLRFFEPYQPDKIPLLFVHGLISDPTTFIEMADAVRADPVLRTRYQIWAFRYPTGEAFLKSAAMLRQDLAAAFACHSGCASTHDGTGNIDIDKRMVIVGHSMGGLVAKMQITNSSDRLWRSVANVPIEHLRGPPDAISSISDAFFFEANPNIGRVVYIATPHRGSPLASRCIGRIGALLARKRSDDKRLFSEFVNANPGAFSGELGDSLPTSVDLLQPTSKLLQSLASLESSPAVSINSIIGNHYGTPHTGRSDGVVPINSAYVEEAETTAFVDATHTSIQHSPDAKQELLRILNTHLMQIHPRIDHVTPPNEFIELTSLSH